MHHMGAFPHKPQRRLLPSVISYSARRPHPPPFSRHISSHPITNTCRGREGLLLHPRDPARESRTALKRPPRRKRKARVKIAPSSRKCSHMLMRRASETNSSTSVTGASRPSATSPTHSPYSPCLSRCWLVCNRIAAVAPPCTRARPAHARTHARAVHHKTQPAETSHGRPIELGKYRRSSGGRERPHLLTRLYGLSLSLWALQGPISTPIAGHVWTACRDYSGRPGICQLQGGVSL